MVKTYKNENWQTENSLFPPKEVYLLSHDTKGRSYTFMQLKENQRRIIMVDNLHLISSITRTTPNNIPILNPYNGTLDFEYVSYKERKKRKADGCAMGFFLHDCDFTVPIWNKLEQTTHSIINYDVVFAPDFSLYVDNKFEMMNRYNVYRSRFVGAYWQHCGLSVIPVASWGNADSFLYCFEGLPENSVIAVCGIGHDGNPQAHRLWCAAIRELVRQKKPTSIIVYGGNKCSVQGVNINLIFIPDYIHKNFRNEKLRKK